MLRKLGFVLTILVVSTLLIFGQDFDDPGFTPLFDGQDLKGWRAMGQEDWHAEGGILWTEGKGGWLRSDQRYADFILRLEYRVTKGAASGLYLRAAEQGNPAFTGLEIPFLDDAGHPTDLHSSGAIYGAIIPLYSVGRKAGEWNQVEITLTGRHLTMYLNGNRIHKIDFDDPAFVFAEKRPLSRVPNEGYIGLASQSNRVDFRSIRIQVLKPSA